MSGVFIFHKTTKVTRGKNFAALCLRKLSLAVHKIECPIYFYRSLMCQFLENANINDNMNHKREILLNQNLENYCQN